MAEPRRSWPAEMRRREPPEPASFAPALQIHGGVNVIGDAPGMFDVLTVHIHDMQGAIRRVDEIHRPKPIVRRGDHLGLAVDASGFKSRTLRRQLQAVEQVPGALTDEDVATI